jgi:hypothetical protein
MKLLDDGCWRCPEVAAVVVTETDHPALCELAWELGATYVHSPLSSRGELPALVGHAMHCLLDEIRSSPERRPKSPIAEQAEETGELGA